jgi:hypothetical protein|tara:strand:+ start:1643 stop:2161 length:519 start_codon:yes stop_codon:yes gene_type:complete
MNSNKDKLDQVSRNRDKMNMGWCVGLVGVCLLHSYTNDPVLLEILVVTVTVVATIASLIGIFGIFGITRYMYNMVAKEQHEDLAHVAENVNKSRLLWVSINAFTVWYISGFSIENPLYLIPCIALFVWMVVSILFRAKVISLLKMISTLGKHQIEYIKIIVLMRDLDNKHRK